MLSDKRISELVVLLKKHVQASPKQKVKIEKEMKRYGCSNSKQAFKKIKQYKKGKLANKIK